MSNAFLVLNKLYNNVDAECWQKICKSHEDNYAIKIQRTLKRWLFNGGWVFDGDFANCICCITPFKSINPWRFLQEIYAKERNWV